jgi:phage recombination protein Bet
MNELQVKQNGQIGIFPQNRVEIIKNTLCKGITDTELELFSIICERTGLDPFSRQIYVVKRKNNKTGRDDITIQTGIDGFRLIASRTGLHMGTPDTEFEYDKDENLIKATVIVYKWNEKSQTKCEFTATAYLTEYMPSGNLNFMWQKMPRVMLEKCAEAKALRKAFPQELSGLYESSEMDQAYDSDASSSNNTTIKETKKSIPKKEVNKEEPKKDVKQLTPEQLTPEQLQYKELYDSLLGLCSEMVVNHGFMEDDVKKLIESVGKPKLKDYDYHGLLVLKDVLNQAIIDKLPTDEDDEDDLK